MITVIKIAGVIVRLLAGLVLVALSLFSYIVERNCKRYDVAPMSEKCKYTWMTVSIMDWYRDHRLTLYKVMIDLLILNLIIIVFSIVRLCI